MSTRGRLVNVVGIVLVLVAAGFFLFGNWPVAAVVFLVGGYLIGRARLMLPPPRRPGQIG